jgi:hypothetical protein
MYRNALIYPSVFLRSLSYLGLFVYMYCVQTPFRILAFPIYRSCKLSHKVIFGNFFLILDKSISESV